MAGKPWTQGLDFYSRFCHTLLLNVASGNEGKRDPARASRKAWAFFFLKPLSYSPSETLSRGRKAWLVVSPGLSAPPLVPPRLQEFSQ